MKWFGYGWAVFTAFITVVIALVVVNAFSSQFERLVVDLLVLIYVAVRSGAQAQGFVTVEQDKMNRNRFVELMKAVGSQKFDSEEHKERLEEEEKTLHQSMVKGWIHAVSLLLIFFIALGNLVYAL